jgi:hypothetical protein
MEEPGEGLFGKDRFMLAPGPKWKILPEKEITPQSQTDTDPDNSTDPPSGLHLIRPR